MTWTKQRQLVSSLADRAQEQKREARRVRSNLKGWLASYLGSPETLVWLFAAGSFWGAGGSATAAKSGKRRSMMAVINTSLLAWQLVNRELKLADPATSNSSEEQR